jgi:hypothetical protein
MSSYLSIDENYGNNLSGLNQDTGQPLTPKKRSIYDADYNPFNPFNPFDPDFAAPPKKREAIKEAIKSAVQSPQLWIVAAGAVGLASAALGTAVLLGQLSIVDLTGAIAMTAGGSLIIVGAAIMLVKRYIDKKDKEKRE